MTTALIYVRQSRNKSYERTVSPEVQEAACRALPAVQACDRVEVLRDLDLSGGTTKRPGYQALLEWIGRAGREPFVIAVYDQSRLSRDNLASAAFYAALEERPWIDVVLVDGRFDRSPAGEVTWGVMALVDTNQRKSTSAKIRAAYRELNRRGLPTGGAPYGYVYEGGSRKNGRLAVDEPKATVVRRIFADYASGEYTTRTLAERLNTEAIAPPGRRPEWLPDTLAQILQNVAYIGKTYTESRLRRRGDLIAAQWPALVDEGVFQRAKDRRDSFRVPITKGGSHSREFALRGLLWCSCGERMWCQHSGGIDYVLCGSRRRAGASCEHAKHGIREADLLPWVDRLIDAWAASGVRGSGLLRRQVTNRDTAAQAAAKVERMITRLGVRFQVGEIDEDEYRTELDRLRRQRDIYLATAADEPDPRELVGVVGAWRSGDPAERRAALASLFERLHVRDRAIVGYTPRADRVARVTLLVDSFLMTDHEATLLDEESDEAASHDREAALSSFESGGGRGI